MATKSPDLKVLPFKTAKAFGSWLQKNHAKSSSIWLQFFKKGSGIKTITYAEALDEALCWGWIDSQSKSFDDKSYLQRFGPRKTKSMWSKLNREHIARLTKEGRMQPAGLKEVASAKKDGRWDSAYDSPKNMQVPPDFLKALKKDKKTYAFFLTLNKANVYAIAWRLQTAKKPETRERRKKALLDMLAQSKKLH
jgi:uncharacterized protein YdeI (YjbR/CyaY-like superfamily)